MNEKDIIATNLYRRYTMISNRGMKHTLFCMIWQICNPCQNHKFEQRLYNFCSMWINIELKDASVIPVLQYNYIKMSKQLVSVIKTKNLLFQLAAPHNHQLTPIERSIQIYKTILYCYLSRLWQEISEILAVSTYFIGSINAKYAPM